MIRKLKEFVWKLTNGNVYSIEYTNHLLSDIERRVFNAIIGCYKTIDIDAFKLNVLYYGHTLLDIQRDFERIEINPFCIKLANHQKYTRETLNDAIHTYAEYISWIQEGKLPEIEQTEDFGPIGFEDPLYTP